MAEAKLVNGELDLGETSYPCIWASCCSLSLDDTRLTTRVLLIAIADTTAILQGSCVKDQGLQKYIGRVKEPGRIPSRHSTFWVGFYAHDGIEGGDVVEAWVSQWLKLHPQKLQNYQRGLRAKELMLSTF